MRQFTDDLSPAERQLLTDVYENGVHIVHVPAAGDRPGYSHTIGLWHHFEQPEVIAFGLPEEVATELLEVLTDEADEGRQFRHGEKHEGLLVDYAVRFVDVPADRLADYFGTALWAYQGVPMPCVQLVWPDKGRRWPWDEGARDGFKKSQPVLGSHDS